MTEASSPLLAIIILVVLLILFSSVLVWAMSHIIRKREAEQHPPSSEGLLNPKHRNP